MRILYSDAKQPKKHPGTFLDSLVLIARAIVYHLVRIRASSCANAEKYAFRLTLRSRRYTSVLHKLTLHCVHPIAFDRGRLTFRRRAIAQVWDATARSFKPVLLFHWQQETQLHLLAATYISIRSR